MPRNFWMITCNEDNYRITCELGFSLQGLKAQHRRKVQRIEPGDRILFYVYGIRRFTATATATSGYVEIDRPVWKNEGSADWPYQIKIVPAVVLDEGQYIDANQLAHRLDYVRRWPPENWHMAFIGNLHLLPKNDFFLIEEEMKKLKLGREFYLRQITSAASPEQATPRKPRQNRRRKGNGGGNGAGPNQPPGPEDARRASAELATAGRKEIET